MSQKMTITAIKENPYIFAIGFGVVVGFSMATGEDYISTHEVLPLALGIVVIFMIPMVWAKDMRPSKEEVWKWPNFICWICTYVGASELIYYVIKCLVSAINKLEVAI